MAYVVRTKDNPGDVGRAADQQQSVDNETALYASLLGPGPVAAGGFVRQFIKKAGIADNVATEIFTVTTTNEAGDNDGGAYRLFGNMLCVHNGSAVGDNAVWDQQVWVQRACQASGSGQVAVGGGTAYAGACESEGGATKGIASVVFSVAETTEQVISVRVQINLDGAAVTTGYCAGMIELTYVGFTTPPVITSAG